MKKYVWDHIFTRGTASSMAQTPLQAADTTGRTMVPMQMHMKVYICVYLMAVPLCTAVGIACLAGSCYFLTHLGFVH